MEDTTAGATPKEITVEIRYSVATQYKHNATLSGTDIEAMETRGLDVSNPYDIFDYLWEEGRFIPGKDTVTVIDSPDLDDWKEFTHIMPNGDPIAIEG
jgi:hypothetical protein